MVKAGDKVIFRGEVIGTFDGVTSACHCGGKSFHGNMNDGERMGLCADMFTLTDDGWVVTAASAEWFGENVVDYFAEKDPVVRSFSQMTGIPVKYVRESFR